MRKTILFIFALINCVFIFAQNSKYAQLIDSAEATYKAKQFQKSIVFYDKAVIFEPYAANSLYNAACSAALSNQKEKAFNYLAQSIEAGWSDEKHANADSDLEILRKDAVKWAKTIATMKNKKALFDTALTAFLRYRRPGVFHFEQLMPYYEKGKWGVMHKDSLTMLLPPSFDNPCFFGFEAYASFQNKFYLIDLDAGTFKPDKFKDFHASWGGGMTEGGNFQNNKPNVELPKKGFTLDYGKLKTVAPIYETFNLHESVDSKLNHTYWGIVKLKNTGKWGIVDTSGNSLDSTKLDYKNLTILNDQFYGNGLLIYEKTKGEKGILSIKGGHYFVNAFDTIEPLKSDYMYRESQYRQFFRYKKNGKWGVLRKFRNDSNAEIVSEAKYDAVPIYAYSYRGKYTEGYYPEAFYIWVELGKEKFFIDDKGKEYRKK
jgi:hypothetical protein